MLWSGWDIFIHKYVKNPIHGFRFPFLSDIAPKIGAKIATAKKEILIAVPHIAVPTSIDFATLFDTYVAKTKVIIKVKKAWLAQSYSAHEIILFLLLFDSLIFDSF